MPGQKPGILLLDTVLLHTVRRHAFAAIMDLLVHT
jgi:hypothetical protein